MMRRRESSEYRVVDHPGTAVGSSAQVRRVSRRIGILITAILLSVLAIWGSILLLRTAYAVPCPINQRPNDDDSSPLSSDATYPVPELVKTIPLGENAKPIAVVVNPDNDYAYVVNIGTGTVAVVGGMELLTTIDLKTVEEHPASPCPDQTSYGRCLNAVEVNRVSSHVYVTEWYYDVAQIISGTEVIGWVYAGKGPAGIVPHPNNDSIYALDKWTPGVTFIQGDRDRCFISGSEPNGGVVDPRTGYAYIANSGSDSVAVISDCTKIVDVPVGSYPNGIAYNPGNGCIYVVNSGSRPATVSVISGTQVIADPIPVGTSNTDLGVDGFWGVEREGSTQIIGVHPSGYVYVANWYSNTVSVISGAQWITDIVVGTNPNTVGVHPASGYVFVANTGSDDVSVIRGTSVLTTVAVGDYPFDLAVDPIAGYVYVANRDDDSISVLAVSSALWLPIVVNDWSQSSIEFTYVPAWGSFDDLHGRVQNVLPSEYNVAVYIYVSGWWTKPYWGSPLTPIRDNGSWMCDITTGGIDQQATKIAAFLIPNGYDPPLMSGGQTLPAELYDRAVANVMVEREPLFRNIEFSGYIWRVKASETPAGPGPNYFSDRVEDVWVDEDDRLHMRIAYRDGRWYCTEVLTEEPLGYGKYVFHLASPVDQLDQNIVLGLFTWDDTAPEYNYREIDIEFSKWGQADNESAQYVVQPYVQAENMHRFDMELTGDDSTHGFDWQVDRIFFQSSYGNQPFPGPAESEIESWTYTGGDIPPAGEGNARINLWLFRGDPPSGGQAAEVVIEAFEFVPQTELDASR